MIRLFLLSLSLVLPAGSALAQVPPEKAMGTMTTAPGFQVELFASEPMLINPTSMDIDHKGRVWVAEAVNYRRKNFGRPILREAGDRIVVLVDKDGDGKADEAVTFYQGKDLYGPLGVCVAPYPDGKGQKVFVCQSPDLLVFEDKDGDLKADGPPKKLLTGFGGFDHDHGVHGVNIGPDGKLYFTVGDAGVKGLQSSDGKGKKWESNGTDCRAGTVWRCDQDGTNLELIAHNFRNNYECCVDSFGEVWLSDNDDDGNRQTRICYVMPGGDYGYHPRGKGESHWHEEQPGIVHKTLGTGFGSPTGITFYEGSLFPEKYRGNLLHCDAGPREVRAFFKKPKGAGYELDKEVLLTSTDPWFRPSDVCVAPDGSIFVADWYDPGVGGHGMGDWTRGRIYRLTPKGHKGYSVPEVKLDTRPGILNAVQSPGLATRAYVHSYLESLEKPDALMALAYGVNACEVETTRARCVWQLGQLLLVTRPTSIKPRAAIDAYYGPMENSHKKPDLAARYYRMERNIYARETPFYGVVTAEQSARFSVEDATKLPPDYARELLLAALNLPTERAKPLILGLAKLYDGQDIFYRAALNIACGTDPKRRDEILADFDKHFPEWNDAVADLVWELRPKSVMPRLEKLLVDPKLTPAQKARIVDILAASADPAAGQSLLGLLASDSPDEVKARAVEQIRLFLPGKWKSMQGSEALAKATDTLIGSPKTAVTGLQLIAAANAVSRVDQVAALAIDDKATAAVRAEAVRTLGKLKSLKSVTALTTLATGSSPLAVEAVNALAQHVTGSTKDETNLPAFTTLQKVFAAAETSEPLRTAALEALAGTRPGTQYLLELKAHNTLPEAFVATAGRLLRNSPYPDLRNKAVLAFPPADKLNPKKLPPIATLAKRTGDVERGKKVWAASLTGASQCAKCHMVRGTGGQVGPDLSMIGKKASKENLFESILMPSKAIADQYIQQSVSTAAGLTVSGLVVSDTKDALTLRDANGKDTVIPTADIESRKKLQVSIMPEDIVAGLTEEELTDLVAYLQTLQTAALTPTSVRVAGPFPSPGGNDGLEKEYGPEKGPFDLAAKFPAQDKEIVWRTIKPDAKGYFDLAGLHGAAGENSLSYLYLEIDSPGDQDAELLLGADDGCVLRVNGTVVFTDKSARAAAPDQHRVPVKLKKGNNSVLLKIANGGNPHGFYFTLLSGAEVKQSSR